MQKRTDKAVLDFTAFTAFISVAGCIFHNKLPNNIKQIENNNQFARELKKLLIKGCYYSIQDYFN
jgi:hypothetical protein